MDKLSYIAFIFKNYRSEGCDICVCKATIGYHDRIKNYLIYSLRGTVLGPLPYTIRQTMAAGSHISGPCSLISRLNRLSLSDRSINVRQPVLIHSLGPVD